MTQKNSFTTFSSVGISFGALLMAFSMTPSLIPRTAVYQALVSALAFIGGYGLAVGANAIWRYLQLPVIPKRHQKLATQIMLAASAVVLAYFSYRSLGWQNELRQMVSLPNVASLHTVATLMLAIVLAYALLLGARGLWYVAGITARGVDRIIPRRIGLVLGVVAAILVVATIVNGVLLGTVSSVVNSAYSLKDSSNYENVSPPTSKLRSGGPESLVAWDSLGREGRRFVGTGPTAAEITDYSGEPALEPIRIYIGSKSANTHDERSALGLQELIRTDAFRRKLLVLVTSTGNGWVDSNAVDPLEYIYGGDTAILAFQYSYLPSALELLADKDAATAASVAMFDEVHQYWSALDEESRPDLYLHGLSLGAYGSQAAVSSVQLFNDPIHGALWAGPPFVSEFWQRLVQNRDAGTPIWRPVYQGGNTIRFTNQGEGLLDDTEDWKDNRIIFLQHAGDPIVLFSPDILFRPPEWLQPTGRSPKAPPSMRWFPAVTFWQMIIDMWLGTKDTLPDGNGHRYGSDSYIEGWIALTEPPGWNDERVEAFKNYFSSRGNPNKP